VEAFKNELASCNVLVHVQNSERATNN